MSTKEAVLVSDICLENKRNHGDPGTQQEVRENLVVLCKAEIGSATTSQSFDHSFIWTWRQTFSKLTSYVYLVLSKM